jgi:cell filamentation protein
MAGVAPGGPPEQSRPSRNLPAPRYATLDAAEIAWDAYLIPDTNTLRNKLGGFDEPYGVVDPDVLAHREERFAAIRMIELRHEPIAGQFDFAHMQQIHEHLFQDVYDWAGQQRTVNMTKSGYSYAPTSKIERMWNQQHEFLMDPAEFADKFAEHWGGVNVAHAFREGNTRSQAVYFAQLADQAGWELDVARLSPDHPESIRDEFVQARFHHQSHSFDHAPLAQVLAKVLTHREPELQRELHPGKDLGSVPHRMARKSETVTVIPTRPKPDLAARYRQFPELAPGAGGEPGDGNPDSDLER